MEYKTKGTWTTAAHSFCRQGFAVVLNHVVCTDIVVHARFVPGLQQDAI